MSEKSLPQFWLILSCLHWYKWTGEDTNAPRLRCPNCRDMADVLDRVPVSENA